MTQAGQSRCSNERSSSQFLSLSAFFFYRCQSSASLTSQRACYLLLIWERLNSVCTHLVPSTYVHTCTQHLNTCAHLNSRSWIVNLLTMIFSCARTRTKHPRTNETTKDTSNPSYDSFTCAATITQRIDNLCGEYVRRIRIYPRRTEMISASVFVNFLIRGQIVLALPIDADYVILPADSYCTTGTSEFRLMVFFGDLLICSFAKCEFLFIVRDCKQMK